MGEQSETTDTTTSIKVLASDEAADVQKDAMDRLVEREILLRREKKSLLGFRSSRYRTVDGDAASEVKERMRGLILSDDIFDPRDVALLSLVDACNILPDIFPGGEVRTAGERIKQLRGMDLVVRDVVGAVAEIERMIVAARAHGTY